MIFSNIPRGDKWKHASSHKYYKPQISWTAVLTATRVAKKDRDFLASLHVRLFRAATLRCPCSLRMLQVAMNRWPGLTCWETLKYFISIMWAWFGIIGSRDNLYGAYDVWSHRVTDRSSNAGMWSECSQGGLHVLCVWQSVPYLLLGVRDGCSVKVLMTLNFERKMTVHKRNSVRGGYEKSMLVNWWRTNSIGWER